MTITTHHPILTRLHDALWQQSGLDTRSEELTPIYVDRFKGPRIAGNYTPHPFWEMGAVMEGKGELRTRSVIPLRKSVTFLIPPGVGHTEYSGNSIDIIWVGLRGTLLDRKRTDRVAWIVNPRLLDDIEDLWLTAIGHHGGIGPELDGMTHGIAARFFRNLAENNSPERTAKVAPSVGYMRKHLEEPLTVTALAERFGCSDGHFRRMFKVRTGTTPTNFLARLRIQHAMRLLEHSNLPVSEVSRKSGYPDSFYFSRVFQKFTGHGPRAYRKAIRPRDAASGPS